MSQPIPKKVKQNNPDFGMKTFNTLLVDGSNILELSSLGDRTISSNGKQIGGIFQFLLQIKLLLAKANFRYVYVFWDGDDSGYYRFLVNEQYKMNRDKNYVIDEGLSDYMKEYNSTLKRMQNYIFNKKKKEKADEQKENKEIFFEQREVIMNCLEELFVRQVLCEKVEADDLIAYYVNHKKPNERIVIMSNDRDLTQLISDDVIIYVQQKKKFINKKNHTEEIGYYYENVLLKKILCGDSSDSIKGIKGFGEITLLNNFPEIKTRKVSLEEVIEKAKKINEDRTLQKKKPLQWAKNIVERVTTGAQGDRIYEINRKIIDLKNPLMTDEAKEMMDSMMYSPLDPEGRSYENLYKILCDAGVDNLIDPNRFSNFFIEYAYLIDKERKNS
jgi:5'-3' exonuclease